MTDIRVADHGTAVASLPPQQQMTRGFWQALRKMADVIGGLIMRELHTRYGRDNVGYLWLFIEPMTLGGVIGLLHAGGGHSAEYSAGITPIAFAVTGYATFIMFRGIVNRSTGAVEANAPLLYHKQLQVIDLVIAKALLEAASTFCAFGFLMVIIISLGFAELPARPLYLIGGILLLFWISTAISMLVMAGAYEMPMIERWVHVFTYFSMPLSGAFISISWVPQPYRYYLTFSPLPTIFEMIRYGQFDSAPDKYIFPGYTIAWCVVLTALGLVCVKSVRRRVHLH